MPEFYAGSGCRYQPAAQPYLDAIARGFRDSAESRIFVLRATDHEHGYTAHIPLWEEQWVMRDPANSMICPFWSNYWYNPCGACNCRIDSSVAMEVDAIFFLRNSVGSALAVHVEMKRDPEALSLGQAEAYKPRAACFRDGRRVRKGLTRHDDFVTVLFCGLGTDVDMAKEHFDRVILHSDARSVFSGYPST